MLDFRQITLFCFGYRLLKSTKWLYVPLGSLVTPTVKQLWKIWRFVKSIRHLKISDKKVRWRCTKAVQNVSQYKASKVLIQCLPCKGMGEYLHFWEGVDQRGEISCRTLVCHSSVVKRLYIISLTVTKLLWDLTSKYYRNRLPNFIG